jgi:hypothetical protein
MPIDFEYELDPQDMGWARCAIIGGDNRIETEVSYIADSIGRLATFARTCVDGFATDDIPFAYEPGAWVCRFAREGPRILLIVRDDPEDTRRPLPKDAPILLEAEEHHRQFAVNICRLLHSLWIRHGLLGYRRLWDLAEFPFHQYLHLRLLLDRSPLVARIAESLKAKACTRELELTLLNSEPDLSPEGSGVALDFDFSQTTL